MTVVTTKRELLLFICDYPGVTWDTPDEFKSRCGLTELLAEGWIMEMLGGFEPTAKALDQYPLFLEQADIADQEHQLRWPNESPPIPEVSSDESPSEDVDAVERVALLLIALMTEHAPLGILLAAVGQARKLQLQRETLEAQLALEYAERLLR